MADAIYLSHYPRRDVDRDDGQRLSDERFAYYLERLPIPLVRLREEAVELDADYVNLAINYAGLLYNEGTVVKGISWCGTRRPRIDLIRLIDALGANPPVIITRAHEVWQAIQFLNALVPGVRSRRVENVVAYSLREGVNYFEGGR